MNDLRDRAYNCACEHGFHDKEYSDEHWLMLTLGEVAEMVEADRKGEYPDINAFEKSDTVNDEDFKDKFERFIKNTVYDEMADVVIRLLDFSGLRGYDLKVAHDLPFMHVNVSESSFTELGYFVCQKIVTASCDKDKRVVDIIELMFYIASSLGADLMWFIEHKMRYNELRPYKNGKRY